MSPSSAVFSPQVRPEAPTQMSSRLSAVQVYERLREEIVSLALPPGSVINRADIQSRFGLSSTPIRDALMRLDDEGLVEVFPQSATRVSLIDVHKAHETQFLRRSLELEAVMSISLAADKAVVPVLRALVREQERAARDGDYPAFEFLDKMFHRRIYEAAGVPDLFQLVCQRNGHIDRIRHLNLPVEGKMQEVIRDHGLIVEAMAESDASGAQRHTRDHLSRSLAYTPALVDQYPSFFKSLR